MIDAKDLRIGLYVDVPRKDQSPFRIDGFEYLNKDDCKVFQDMGTYYVDDTFGEVPLHELTWYLKDLEPIPLSPDILEKCGFTVSARRSYLKAEADSVIDMYFEGGKFWIQDENWFEQNMPHIKHLHQLQNLYKSLTGKELSINL